LLIFGRLAHLIFLVHLLLRFKQRLPLRQPVIRR
jgi:hypothetical protein